LTAEEIAAARSARKEEKKAKAAAGGLNDEDADLPVNANRLPVKNMAISDINTPRELSSKERSVHCMSNSDRDLTANQGGQREARSKGAVLECRCISVLQIPALTTSHLVAPTRQDRPS